MIKALTRSRSADFHRQTMLKTLLIGLILILCWEPIRPARTVTADVLVHVSEMIRR
jgi:hypothetical protein